MAAPRLMSAPLSAPMMTAFLRPLSLILPPCLLCRCRKEAEPSAAYSLSGRNNSSGFPQHIVYRPEEAHTAHDSLICAPPGPGKLCVREPGKKREAHSPSVADGIRELHAFGIRYGVVLHPVDDDEISLDLLERPYGGKLDHIYAK